MKSKGSVWPDHRRKTNERDTEEREKIGHFLEHSKERGRFKTVKRDEGKENLDTIKNTPERQNRHREKG